MDIISPCFPSFSLHLSSWVLSLLVNSWSTFLSKFIGHFPSLVVSLQSLPPLTLSLSIIAPPSPLRSPPSPSLPGWLQIGYFLHALSRALIRGKVLIVGLSLRLTDSSGCAAEMPDLVNVCLWALSPHLILTALTVCAGSLSPSCCPPPPFPHHHLPPSSVSISIHSLLRTIVFQPPAKHFLADPPLPSFLLGAGSAPWTPHTPNYFLPKAFHKGQFAKIYKKTHFSTLKC